MLAALEVQGRVIKALFLREMKTRFGDKRMGFAWAFLEPAIHVFLIIGLWKFLGRMGPQGIDPILFLITGIIPYTMFVNIMNKVMNSLAGNRALMVFPQIQVIDFVISRIVVELATYMSVFIIFVIGCRYVGYEFEVEYPLGVMINFVLIALVGGGIGFILMPLLSIVRFLEHVVKLFQRVIYLTSGVFFSVERLPHEAQSYLEWNPMLQLLHGIRADFFYQMPLNPRFNDPEYVVFLIMSLWVFGIVLTKKLFRYVIED
jgi:capsular polysaccharide transport system permease protein